MAKGKVLLDGRPISDYDVRHLRRHIGVVAQDNILFSASILENIVYGMGQGHLPEASMEDVKEACDMANVTEFLETFPNGVHTFVGEKGVKLSGGQKQRLAIARAIIRCAAACAPTLRVFSVAHPRLLASGNRRSCCSTRRRAIWTR